MAAIQIFVSSFHMLRLLYQNANEICQVRRSSDNILVPVGPSNLTRERVTRFSPVIRMKLRRGTKRIYKSMIELREENTTVFGANEVLQWIATVDLQHPNPMTLQAPKIKSFDEAVQPYHAANALGVGQSLCGVDIIKTIIGHMDSGVLGVHEFSLDLTKASWQG